MSDGSQTIGAKYGTLERGTKYYFEKIGDTLYCVTVLATSDGSLVTSLNPLPVTATDLDIRNLVSADVVTAELSAIDNAVLDDIALNQTDGTQTTKLSDLSAANTGRTTATEVLPVQIVDAAGRVPAVDSTTKAQTTITYEHHEIHSGSMFTVQHSGAAKGDGDTINLYIKTPNTTKWPHMLVSWSASGAAYMRIHEAPTVTANTGTSTAIYNRNRNSGTASTVLDNATSPVANKASYDITGLSGGTTIFTEYAGSAKTSAAMARGTNEFILDQNTAYVFEVESDAAGLTLWLSLDFYEHTDS